jgi:hypothetical protein
MPTHRILAVILDDIEMLRDRFMAKQREEPTVSDGFRSVIGYKISDAALQHN